MRKLFSIGCLAIAIYVGSELAAYGQAVTGTILGSIHDASGAPVPSAPVRIDNTATGTSRTMTTNSAGDYEAPSLPPGSYSVSVEAQGFKKVTAQNIQLSVDEKARVDLTLAIGSVSETVEVNAAVPLVQSETSELGTTVNQTQIRELPLNGRNFVQLTRLIPGVQRGIPGSNSDGSGSVGFRASASFSANGMRARDNNFILDGVDDNELLLSTVVVFPSVDALQEFKVQTSTYSAEFGRSLGGVVNLQIKSGSNQLHGNLFEFVRNDLFDANDWFNNKFGRAKPPFRQNQFGGTLGGPLWRNHTFFFVDYQGMRVRQANSYLSTVPTADMRAGNFSAIRRAIYDATSRTAFAGNVIPAARQDAVARNIIDQLYPLANTPGQVSTTGQTINNFLYNPVSSREDDQYDIKVDHQFRLNNQAFVRYSRQTTDNFLPAALPHGDAGATFGAANSTLVAESAAFNDTHTFSPTLLNEFRFGFSRFGLQGAPLDYGSNLAAKVGLPGVNISDITSAFTQIIFSPGDIQALGANANQPFLGYYNTYQWIDNVTRIVGAHSLKAGFSYTARQRNQFNVNYPVGRYTFQPQLTSNCAGIATGCSVNSNTGFSVASFLLGYASSLTRDYRQGITGERKYELGSFVQDDWKVSQKLTLNLGLRWDFLSPYTEVYNRMANFDPTTARMVLASDSARIGGLSVGRALRQNTYGDFGPRVGLAWSILPDNRLILRAGYGVFYNEPLTGGSSQMTRNPPFGISQSYTASLLPTIQLSNGIPSIPTLTATSPITGALGSTFDPLLKDERGQNWNFDLQRQLGKDFLIEGAYVGSRATRLLMNTNINQAPPVIGVSDQNVNRPYRSVLPGVTNITQVQSRGYASYHALQLKATKRFSRDFMFLGAYTWGKSIDIVSDVESSTLNAYNFNMDRGLSNFDVRHNLVLSWNYTLPFGAKRYWGGWELSGILNLRTGLPFTVTQSQSLLSTGTGNRPNRIGAGTLANPSPDLWFNPASFAATADNTGTYGNAGRNILIGPPQRSLDFSIVKNTRFGERFRHQIRGEFFNALNTPQFGAPNSTIGTAGVGAITSLLYSSPMRQIQLAMKLEF